MKLFLKTFVNKVDAKGRVSVPATFRAAVAHQEIPELVVYPSLTLPCLEGSGSEHIERLAEAVYEMETFSAEQEDLANLIFANANQLSFDSTGRVVLPSDLLKHANIKGKAAFVGRGKTFQIWEPDAFARYQNEARDRVAEQGLTLSLKPRGGMK